MDQKRPPMQIWQPVAIATAVAIVLTLLTQVVYLVRTGNDFQFVVVEPVDLLISAIVSAAGLGAFAAWRRWLRGRSS